MRKRLRRHGWRQGGIRLALFQTICAAFGHAAPKPATLVWDSGFWKWGGVDKSVHVPVCSRCHDDMHGLWSVRFR